MLLADSGLKYFYVYDLPLFDHGWYDQLLMDAGGLGINDSFGLRCTIKQIGFNSILVVDDDCTKSGNFYYIIDKES